MKFYNYFAYLISLIFTVMGILILSNIFSANKYFLSNSSLKYSFGTLLIIYGVFRAVNTYFKSRNKRKNRDDG